MKAKKDCDRHTWNMHKTVVQKARQTAVMQQTSAPNALHFKHSADDFVAGLPHSSRNLVLTKYSITMFYDFLKIFFVIFVFFFVLLHRQ